VTLLPAKIKTKTIQTNNPTKKNVPNGFLKKIRVLTCKAQIYARSRFQRNQSMAKYSTASSKAYLTHGRNFFGVFSTVKIQGRKEIYTISSTPFVIESPHGLELTYSSTRGNKKSGSLGKVGLGFTKDALIIEVIQGKKGTSPEQDRFRQTPKVNTHWANYLLTLIEKQARELGFSEMKIRVPESLYSYHFSSASDMKRVRKEMDAFYYTLATACGFKQKGLFFVKSLKK
jgi:hypothetical protein